MEILIFLLLVVLPLVHVVITDKWYGKAKFGWFLIVLFGSWFGYGAFLVVTHLKEENG